MRVAAMVVGLIGSFFGMELYLYLRILGLARTVSPFMFPAIAAPLLLAATVRAFSRPEVVSVR